MRFLNAIATILMMPLIPLITILSVYDYVYIWGNNIFSIGFLVLCIITIFVCYLIGIVVGLVSMATGKRGAVNTNIVIHKIIFTLEVILGSIVLYSNRNSADPGSLVPFKIIIAIFVFLLITTFVRGSIIKANNDDVVFEGQVKLTIFTILVFIVLPIVLLITTKAFIALTSALEALFEEYPIIRTILITIAASPIIVIGVFLSPLVKTSNDSTGGGSKTTANEINKNRLEQKINDYEHALKAHQRGESGYDYIDPKSQQSAINSMKDKLNKM